MRCALQRGLSALSASCLIAHLYIISTLPDSIMWAAHGAAGAPAAAGEGMRPVVAEGGALLSALKASSKAAALLTHLT